MGRFVRGNHCRSHFKRAVVIEDCLGRITSQIRFGFQGEMELLIGKWLYSVNRKSRPM